MFNVIPVSDMRNYNEALSTVTEGSQVILTKNGKSKYTVIDFNEWQRKEAIIQLFSELEKGRMSLANEPIYTLEESKKMFAEYGVK